MRGSLTSPADTPGRLFAYYLALFSGDNGRPLFSTIYVVSLDGFRYQTDLKGNDPHGFVLYGNQIGYYDSDGQTPLYHDVLSAETAANPNQLTELQGGVKLGAPAFPIFFNEPDPAALAALDIPLTPAIPVVSGFGFQGTVSGNTSLFGSGGTFQFTTSVPGVYEIVVSRDGLDFDP